MGYNTSLPQEAARTHNHSHLNLFLSFILRVVSVLVKDNVLYSSCSTLHCPDQQSSWVRPPIWAESFCCGGWTVGSESANLPAQRPTPPLIPTSCDEVLQLVHSLQEVKLRPEKRAWP